MQRDLRTVLAGLGFAAAGFAWVFRASRPNFWARMTLVAGSLGAYAIALRPDLRAVRPTRGDVATGVATAAGLYGVFQVGDRLARQIMPGGTKEIAAIYRLREEAPRWLIAPLLALIIAPAEEIFWRGLVQGSLVRRYGQRVGAILAAASYGSVHLASGNLTLTGAAATAGSFWGLQYAVQRRLPALIVSHILWDLWIFLVAPTPGGKKE